MMSLQNEHRFYKVTNQMGVVMKKVRSLLFAAVCCTMLWGTYSARAEMPPENGNRPMLPPKPEEAEILPCTNSAPIAVCDPNGTFNCNNRLFPNFMRNMSEWKRWVSGGRVAKIFELNVGYNAPIIESIYGFRPTEAALMRGVLVKDRLINLLNELPDDIERYEAAVTAWKKSADSLVAVAPEIFEYSEPNGGGYVKLKDNRLAISAACHSLPILTRVKIRNELKAIEGEKGGRFFGFIGDSRRARTELGLGWTLLGTRYARLYLILRQSE